MSDFGPSAQEEPDDFASSASRLAGEAQERAALASRELHYGVQFLDDALRGILPHDLILVGAETGGGKTALVSIIAQANARIGKRVVYFALEAEPREIERRMKYREVAGAYFAAHRDGYRQAPAHEVSRLCYRDWYRGQLEFLSRYESIADSKIAEQFSSLYTFYRGSQFTVDDLERQFQKAFDKLKPDLVILDHLHYVDVKEDESENAGYKRIVKKVRDMSLGAGVPVILVAHLRKRDRNSAHIVPDLEDFHGSSDIIKVVTTAIMLAPQKHDAKTKVDPGQWGTYMYIPKDRMDGTLKRFVARMAFLPSEGGYGDKYVLGRSLVDKFQPLDRLEMPSWAHNAAMERGIPEVDNQRYGRD